jgi:hypothetical protein
MKENKLDVLMISQISAFTGFAIDSVIDSNEDNVVIWYLNDGKNHYEIHLNFNKKEVGFVDWIADDKTYFSILGIALSSGYTCEDYFTSK